MKSNEQFTALKQEIEKALEEKAKVEEKELGILFKEDEQKLKIQELTRELGEAEKKSSEDQRALQQKITDCDKAALEKKREREKRLSEIPSEYSESYEALRNNGKKIAVAVVGEDQICGGCFMQVPPQTLNQIKKNIDIQRCDCGRYIYIKD